MLSASSKGKGRPIKALPRYMVYNQNLSNGKKHVHCVEMFNRGEPVPGFTQVCLLGDLGKVSFYCSVVLSSCCTGSGIRFLVPDWWYRHCNSCDSGGLGFPNFPSTTSAFQLLDPTIHIGFWVPTLSVNSLWISAGLWGWTLKDGGL